MKKIILIMMTLLTVFFTGCWDKVDIDRNVFVGVIGVDAGKDIKNKKALEEAKPDEPFGERQIERLNVTFAYPDISQYQANNPQIKGSKLIKTEAYSMEDAVSNATMRNSRNVDISHTKVLLLGSDFLSQSDAFKEVMDFVSRNPKISRAMYVIVAQDNVDEILNFNIDSANTVGAYLGGLMQSSERNAAILPITLHEFFLLIDQNGNAIAPAVRIDRDKMELEVAGIALIKNYKLEGYISPQDTSTVEMLRGKMKGGKKVIYKDQHPIDVEIDGITRKVDVSQNNGKLVFNLDINLEGKIKDYFIDKEIFNTKDLNQIEDYFSKSLSEECQQVARRIQREHGMDILGLSEYVQKYKPDIWSKVKDNWETTFKSSEINTNVNMRIRRIGIKE